MSAAPFKGEEPGAQPAIPPHPRYGPAEHVYAYRDAAGEPAFYVCRYRAGERKTFLQGHFNGAGEWCWNLKGVEPVLYRLPEVLAFLGRNAEHEPLYIVEGEKAVEALRAYLDREGLPGEVTTSPGGAGKWRAEYTEALIGLRYAIVGADNDEPGQRHARHVAAELAGQGTTVELKSPATDKPHAGVDDHLAAGRTLEELVPLAEAGDSEQGPTPYPTLDLAAFLAQPPAEPPWDWRGWYARGDVVLVAGDPGVGKSLVALATVVAAAGGGGQLLGEPVEARRALFIDLESTEDVVYDRLRGLRVHELEEPPAYVHRPPAFNLLDAEGLARLAATVRAARAELVVLDSLRRAAPGLDENDSREVSILFSALRDLAAELGCTIVVIHHPRKPVGDTRVEALYAARGSGDLTGSVDSYLFFRRLEGGLRRIEHGKARRGREHEHTSYRILEGEAGEPVLEHVLMASGQDTAAAVAETLAWFAAYLDEEYAKGGGGVPRGKAEEAYVEAHPERGSRAHARRVIDAQLALAEELAGELDLAEENGEHKLVLAKGPGERANGVYLYPARHAPSPLAVAPNGEHCEQAAWATEAEPLAVLAATLKGGEQNGEEVRGGEGQPQREPDENGDIPW